MGTIGGVRPLGKNDPTSVSSYRLLGVLGGGGMGRVFLGQSRSGRRLAIKMLSQQFADDPEYRERFAREVAAARLVSPLYTAAVVDSDPRAKTPWLATTFIEGPSLEQWVDGHGPLTPDKVLGLAAGLAEALGSIHAVGLVHRDLKPSNVIVNQNGPHIIDFGIALAGGDIRITQSLMVGTPAYMAPERINGLDAGPSGDVYSLGATLYFAATGTQLIDSGNFYEQIIQVAMGKFDLERVPEECRQVIELCLKASPQDRPTPDELMQVLVGLGVTAPETGWWPELEFAESTASPTTLVNGSLNRRRILVGASAVGVLAIGGGIAYAFKRPPPGSTLANEPLPQETDTGQAPATVAPAGRFVWQVAIRADERPVVGDQSATRVFVDRGVRVISSSGPTISALDTKGHPVWTEQVQASALRLWPWGDAVLAGDMRKLWSLDVATGKQRFMEDVAKEEEEYTKDNPDRMAVQIERVVTTKELAIVSLGTALVAMDHSCHVKWRMARPVNERNQRTTLPIVMMANDTYWLTRSQTRIALRRMSDGKVAWQLPVPAGGGAQPVAPPGREGGQDDAWMRQEGRFAGDSLVIRDGSYLEARQVSGGKMLWNFTSQKPVASIDVLDDLVIIGADRLYARRLSNGDPLWEAPLRGARLTVSGGFIYAAHDFGLSKLDTAGTMVWQEPFPGSIPEATPERLTLEGQNAYVVFRPKGPGGPGGPGPGPGNPGKPIDVVAFRVN